MNYLKAKEILESYQERALRSLESAPDGKLRVSNKNGKPLYYHVSKDNNYGVLGKYLPKSKPQAIKRLAQKEYYQKLSQAISKTIRQIEIAGSAGIPAADTDYSVYIYKLQNVYARMHPAKQAMITPFIETDSQFTEKWLHQEYIPKEFYPDSPLIYANSGIRVRSKSEKIIADKLDELSLPYLYERPFKMHSKRIVHPDFTLLDITHRRNIYYEHFGKMDDPEYSTKAVRKINEYLKSGLILGETLLVSFETLSVPIDISLLPQTLTDIGLLPDK